MDTPYPTRAWPGTHEGDEMDATEILKSNAAAAAAADAAWVNPRDPAKAVGPDGLPLRSRRAPKWADVPNEQWDDWRWQSRHRIKTLDNAECALLAQCQRVGNAAFQCAT